MKLSSVAKYAIHAMRNGRILSYNYEITEATMRALERRGLVEVTLQSYGRWSAAKLTEAGTRYYATIECRTCRGSSYVSSPEADGTDVTCRACLGSGHL